MVDKLAEIRAALDAFDKQHEIYLKACNEVMPKEEFEAIKEETDRLDGPLWEGPYTYLRLLLPIVEASDAFFQEYSPWADEFPRGKWEAVIELLAKLNE